MAQKQTVKAAQKAVLSDAEKNHIRSKRRKKFKQFLPLYLMLIPGLIYLIMGVDNVADDNGGQQIWDQNDDLAGLFQEFTVNCVQRNVTRSRSTAVCCIPQRRPLIPLSIARCWSSMT